MAKRLLSVLMVLLLVAGFIPAASAVATGGSPAFADMPDDWSTAALESAVANGLIEGADGKIMPRDFLTRAQMATIIVRAFGAAVEGDISAYSDVRSTDWFAGSMAKAYKMGVMQGSYGKMMPDSNITREQAFVVLARGLKLQPADSLNKTFDDAGEISDWAKGEVYALVNSGYVQGADGKLNPQSNISRAEFAQVMFNLIKQYIGLVGEYTTAAGGNIMVNVPGVTLKGLTIDGDLIIGDGVGDGEVILEDVTVTGRLVVRGGGENSVVIRGASNVAQVIVARVDGVVRVFVEDGADVEIIYIDDGSDDVIVEGAVGSIELAADNVTVTATNATLTDANVTGNNSAIIVDGGSSVGTINISGENTTVSGAGDVGQVIVEQGGDGASIGTGNTQITVGEGVGDVTAGGDTPVEGGSTATNNTEGTGIVEEQPPAGPVAPPYYPVSAITVTGTGNATTITTDNGTLQMSAAVSPEDATDKTVTWSVEAGTGTATISASGLLTALTNGTVTVKATSVSRPSVNGTLVVTISGQLEASTLAFASEGPIDKFTTDAAFTNAATGAGGGAIKYTSGTPAVRALRKAVLFPALILEIHKHLL